MFGGIRFACIQNKLLNLIKTCILRHGGGYLIIITVVLLGPILNTMITFRLSLPQLTMDTILKYLWNLIGRIYLITRASLMFYYILAIIIWLQSSHGHWLLLNLILKARWLPVFSFDVEPPVLLCMGSFQQYLVFLRASVLNNRPAPHINLIIPPVLENHLHCIGLVKSVDEPVLCKHSAHIHDRRVWQRHRPLYLRVIESVNQVLINYINPLNKSQILLLLDLIGSLALFLILQPPLIVLLTRHPVFLDLCRLLRRLSIPLHSPRGQEGLSACREVLYQNELSCEAGSNGCELRERSHVSFFLRVLFLIII